MPKGYPNEFVGTNLPSRKNMVENITNRSNVNSAQEYIIVDSGDEQDRINDYATNRRREMFSPRARQMFDED